MEEKLKMQEGAVLVDNVEIANIDVILNQTSKTMALLIEFKPSLNKYLKEVVSSPVRTLADVIAFDNKFSDLAHTLPLSLPLGASLECVPAGFDSNGVPIGICFGGLRGSEPKLIEIAYGFEQATY
ncbi:hypothetical protein CJ030_MR7G022898 [Morella rubra]|uniref:Amidase domain-containing protein n=1 Tax=Morella rubra TaxID=262757 RepID=A0A6A1V5X1_9ROSI|nr:hypothetical protein CJ030_MR7G022898 [Morella rubra]